MLIHAFDCRGLRLVLQLYVLSFLSLGASGNVGAAICRVTTAGSSGNSGSTWASPIALQTALGGTSCTEIWVKAGVYKDAQGQVL